MFRQLRTTPDCGTWRGVASRGVERRRVVVGFGGVDGDDGSGKKSVAEPDVASSDAEDVSKSVAKTWGEMNCMAMGCISLWLQPRWIRGPRSGVGTWRPSRTRISMGGGEHASGTPFPESELPGIGRRSGPEPDLPNPNLPEIP